MLNDLLTPASGALRLQGRFRVVADPGADALRQVAPCERSASATGIPAPPSADQTASFSPAKVWPMTCRLRAITISFQARVSG